MAMTASNGGRSGDFQLEPEAGIELGDDVMLATSEEAWLKLVPARALAGRRWVRVRYRSSFFDDPVRPLLRLKTSEGRLFFQAMDGPVAGCGEWIGRVHDNTTAVSISPVKRPGRFDFHLDSITPVSRRSLVRRGLRYDRKSLLLSVGGKLINAKEERWETLKFAGSSTPFEDYDQWYRQRERALDLDGIDRPRTDWSAGPAFHLIMALGTASVPQLEATIASLRAQAYRRWSLAAVHGSGTSADLRAAFRAEMAADPRLREISGDDDFFSSGTGAEGRDFVAIVEPGDVLPNYAFATIAESVARAPAARIVYGDEDSLASNGRLHSPVFKPDWSPIFFASQPYLGRLTCIQYRALAECGQRAAAVLVRDEGRILQRLAATAAAGDVLHIRRILYRRGRELDRATAQTVPAAPVEVVSPDPWPAVTIVIPTRDRADLLAQCMKGLSEQTDYPSFRTIIVDNGSVEADALALLKKYEKQPRMQVLRSPGKFNFSALCNAGARAADTPMLVFLNNDIVIFDSAWLRALVRWAVRPEVGVVGSKLLFPDATIEHAGVVLGHGGIAGHIYPWQPASEPGYLRALTVPHEVSAVTGACIAIAREKFEAVGGFDAENLPVDLNDIDLCLRVAQRGWKTVWTPEAVLYHLQSASRGFQFKPSKVYQKERDYFQRRWAQAVRDDPYFHPALSLFSHRPALA